jgi:uncharacterized damage-inducible protein DinB
MKLTELFAGMLDREAPICRRVLERVPEHRADWKPHEKSMPLGYLSGLVASMPSWMAMAIEQDELDLNPPGGKPQQSEPLDTRAGLVKVLDESIAKARAALAGTNDAFLMTPWKLLVGGQVVQESARHAVIADTFTHLAHHRGQLSVYLRLNDAAVPSIYGPSADEQKFG